MSIENVLREKCSLNKIIQYYIDMQIIIIIMNEMKLTYLNPEKDALGSERLPLRLESPSLGCKSIIPRTASKDSFALTGYIKEKTNINCYLQ